MMKVAIIGTVGIGKTTIIKSLCEKLEGKLEFEVYPELEKYSYLEKAYLDMPKWAYIMQKDFLMLRLRTLHSIPKKDNKIHFFDRSYIDDYLYAKRSFDKKEMNEIEWNHYLFDFDKFTELTISEGNNYDLIIILKQPSKGIAQLRRIKRNRFNEKDLNHFFEIDEMYENDWFFNHCKKYVKNVEYVIASTPDDASNSILEIIGK